MRRRRRPPLGKALSRPRTSSPTRLPRRRDLRSDKDKIGKKVGNANVRHPDEPRQVVEEDIVVGVLAVPTAAAQPLADQRRTPG